MALTKLARKTKNLSARLSPDELNLIRRGASLRKVKTSEYLVSAAKVQAEIDLADRADFVLPNDRALAFLKALDRPAQPKPELVELFSTKTVFD